MYRYLFIIAILCLSYPRTVLGQGNYIDTVFEQAKLYNGKKTSSVLFVHIDKSVYVSNETIWFAAYLLDPDSNLLKHEVISVGLVNNNTKKLIAESKYPMRGFAHGNLLIPDTITPGNYSFIAITNLKVNGRPALRFVQPLTIKTGIQPPFTVSITLDTLFKDPHNARVLINARGPSGPLDKADISYFLGKDKATRLVGEARTNVIGSYTLMIPKNKINNLQHDLEVQVKHAKTVKTLHLDIPVKKQVNDVRFYPESGHLVSGIISRVAWEAKTPGGTPIKASAILYANNKIIDTIQTDSYGMGNFSIDPTTAKSYSAKLIGVKNDDVVYPLPRVLPAGVILYMPDAIAKDTAKLTLRSSFPGKFTLVLHNYRQVFSAIQVDANKVGRSVKINLSHMPRGLTTVTVLDSYQKPVAERLFFAHYDERSQVAIKVDDKQPGLRQKMSVRLKLEPGKTPASSALVSVAIVQDNRFEIKKENNIEHYYYLRNQLDNLPVKDDLMSAQAADLKYLNDLLLVRGWSKYNWPDLIAASPRDTLKAYSEFGYKGVVTYLKDSLKKPATLLLKKDSSVVLTFDTDNRGYFDLTNAEVFAKKADRRIRLWVVKEPMAHTINLSDQYQQQQVDIANNIEIEPFDLPVTNDSKEFVFAAPKAATNLKQVTIKAKVNKTIYGANYCGDYVCRFGVLNCYNHPAEPDNRWPKNGEMLRDAGGGGLIRYVGCGESDRPTPGVAVFNGINNAKEYYGADYKLMNPLEPDYLSTVFWKHDVMLSKDKETELSFYTSDITGKFRIVVQGVTDKDVIYTEGSYEAVKKGDK